MSTVGDSGDAPPIDTRDVRVTPTPTDDELAAILAAYQQLWPQAVAADAPAPAPRWRFGGRPWNSRSRYGGWR